MAYVAKEVIQQAREELKKLNKSYGMKGSISGTGQSTLTCTISAGIIDFFKDDFFKKSAQVNHYWLEQDWDGKALEYLEKVKKVLYRNHWDNSDSQSDYFSCAYYVRINIGKWNKPYLLTKEGTGNVK